MSTVEQYFYYLLLHRTDSLARLTLISLTKIIEATN